MTTAVKQKRCSVLDPQEKAKQFISRGIERTARAEIRSSCDICGKPITEGKYFDINGAKYAHQKCIILDFGNSTKHGKVITHKMMEELSAKKSSALSATRRGRKPKEQPTKAQALSEAVTGVKTTKRGRSPKTHEPQTAMATIKLAEVKESLPGATVTLTITGSVEAVQRALDKLQN